MSKSTLQKTWYSTSKSEKDLQRACELLDTDNQSYALRKGLSLLVKHLEKQEKRESA